jgi:HD-GYP domain-containing protein (c-di-GMP phosphodiesterase class II)
MLLVPTRALKAGMTLAQPIHHPYSEGCVLLNKGAVLIDAYIARLHNLQLSHVWIHVPGFEELDDVVNEQVSIGHIELYDAISSSIDRLERRIEVRINLDHYRTAVRGLLNDIVENPDHEVLTHQLGCCGSALAGHLANCSYLSLLIGAHMAGYLRTQRSTLPADVAENTSELGLGALLHDIGKIPMPDELQNKCIQDPESSWPEYRMHVRAGYEAAHEHVSLVAANVILNHHQRYDGAGFPKRENGEDGRGGVPLAGGQIHIFSRILAAVDAFDHLLCPSGTIVPTIVAIHGLKQPKLAGWFDPAVVETLMRLIPPFQVGSVVTLSDGCEAVVVLNHPEAPCRPRVRLLRAPIGDAQAGAGRRELDLRMCRNMCVAAVNGVDIRAYLFTGELEPVGTRGIRRCKPVPAERP